MHKLKTLLTTYKLIHLSSSDILLGKLSSPLKLFSLERNDLFPNQLLCFIPLVIDVEMAPKKKNPIITHIILSRAIEEEKA